MDLAQIFDTLNHYQHRWASGAMAYPGFDGKAEQARVSMFLDFVKAEPNCCERDNPVGHLTGSAMVTDVKLSKVLLTLHGKLHKWLQLGGHADGSPHLAEVAMREAAEESGLKQLVLYDRWPFDLDRHLIPARKNEAEHYHYDVRYLITTPNPDGIQISEESHDLRWFSLAEARKITSESSMHRQFDKLDFLRARL